MGSDSRSGARPVLPVAVAGLIIAGCGAGGADAPLHSSPALRLVAYHGCGGLLDGLRSATAAHVGPYGLAGDPIMRPLAGGRVPGDVRAAAAVPYSATNVQEPGVDEPDLVKTDGRRIITATGGRLHVVDAASRRQTGTLDLGADAPWFPGELLLGGDRALVILRPAITPMRGGITDIAPRRQSLRAVLVDLAGTPRVVGSVSAEGAYVDARQVGSVARIVLRSTPNIAFPSRRGGANDAEATAANRAAVRKAPLDAWLPRISVAQGRARPTGPTSTASA
jgi:Beta propeller domain